MEHGLVHELCHHPEERGVRENAVSVLPVRNIISGQFVSPQRLKCFANQSNELEELRKTSLRECAIVARRRRRFYPHHLLEIVQSTWDMHVMVTAGSWSPHLHCCRRCSHRSYSRPLFGITTKHPWVLTANHVGGKIGYQSPVPFRRVAWCFPVAYILLLPLTSCLARAGLTLVSSGLGRSTGLPRGLHAPPTAPTTRFARFRPAFCLQCCIENRVLDRKDAHIFRHVINGAEHDAEGSSCRL